jgi:hypothetical protein
MAPHLRQERDGAERRRGDRGHPTGKAVQPVDEVGRVVLPTIEERERTDRVASSMTRNRRVVDGRFDARGDDDGGDDRLAEELPAGTRIEGVVDEPSIMPRTAAVSVNRGGRASSGMRNGRPVAVDEQNARIVSERERDGKPAGSRDRTRMVAAAARDINMPDAGQPADGGVARAASRNAAAEPTKARRR